MDHLRFDNQLVAELPGDRTGLLRSRQVLGAAWSAVRPTTMPAPRLVAHAREVASLLDLSDDDVASDRFAAVFSGNELLPGMDPHAACYGGHQFGSWAGQLGDGRAISLGEVVNRRGERWELQLKGAGRTPYSRHADGRAVLRSSVREFLCSEAMFHLGVPTTRALSLVLTGERVERDILYDGHPKLEPGAIVCRVAPSFLRFGHFELPSARGDRPLLERLVDFTIQRDFPEIEGDAAARRAHWFEQVCARTATLIAHWMRVGFVHGVMNTDNMSILGLTIDYGPYGWVDDYDPGWTPNTTDAATRRYRFGNQPEIGAWNLGRLARALEPVFPHPRALADGLACYRTLVADAQLRMTRDKLGLSGFEDEDEALLDDLFSLLHRAELDMTLFFRGLADVDVAAEAPEVDAVADAFYDDTKRAREHAALLGWLGRYAARARRDGAGPDARRARMNRTNPKYVLRNYLAQEAIDRAEAGDPSRIRELLEVLRRPYDDQPGAERYAAKRPDWARHRPGCSTLSCSS